MSSERRRETLGSAQESGHARTHFTGQIFSIECQKDDAYKAYPSELKMPYMTTNRGNTVWIGLLKERYVSRRLARISVLASPESATEDEAPDRPEEETKRHGLFPANSVHEQTANDTSWQVEAVDNSAIADVLDDAYDGRSRTSQ